MSSSFRNRRPQGGFGHRQSGDRATRIRHIPGATPGRRCRGYSWIEVRALAQRGWLVVARWTSEAAIFVGPSRITQVAR
jgi:hypothetical protein